MQTLLARHWHHLPREEVVELLDSDAERGLDLFEVRHRQEHFGPNALTPQRRVTPLQRLLAQFKNPLIYVLLVASVVTVVVKGIVDALIIFLAIVVNAVIGFVQEERAEEAIAALAQSMTTEATVVRAGTTRRVSAPELVPGDLVLLKAGDRVPADLRLIRSRDLQIAEAALTGESVPVSKDAEVTLPPDTPLAERRNMAYASTLVTYGTGAGIVTAIGDGTEVGRISELIASAEQLETPLTRKIAGLSRLLLWAILALAAVTLGIGLIRGQPLVDTFTAAVALAVAMIPEGLPAALTVTLAIGVSRMARRRAVIRHLPAVETLGSVTIICSDKTGTLTQNEMTVQEIRVPGAIYRVSGVGYAPQGTVEQNGQPIHLPDHPALAETLLAGLLCNDSTARRIDGDWRAEGDPTEVALLVVAAKAGLAAFEDSSGHRQVEDQGARWSGEASRGGEAASELVLVPRAQMALPRLDVIPFESEHQYMATLHDAGGRGTRAYVKGSVEAILARCDRALGADGEERALDVDAVHRDVEAMAQEGLRVLAFARRDFPASMAALHHQDIASGLVFLGLQGMIDPPRPEAIAAVRACQTAGIAVKMITGDHALTAAAVARELGLGDGGAEGRLPQVMSGAELDACCDAELIERVERTAVFARVSPEQKLRLVEAFQARGHIVAMTGDGVNDAPALKQADVGIAMGRAGTEVAKEAADMILTDDNFATIEAAVEEGRGVFDNLTKIIVWTLPTNLGEGLILLTAIAAGAVLPILPVQVLWINMATVAVLGIVLALEGREPGIMERPPRPPDAPILNAPLVWRTLLVGLLILFGAFGLFEWELAQGQSVEVARTVAVNMVVFTEVFYLLNCRSLRHSMFRIGVLSNPWVIVGVVIMVLLQLMYTYAPFMAWLLHTAPIGLESWARVLGVGVVGYLVIEVEKAVRRRLVPTPHG